MVTIVQLPPQPAPKSLTAQHRAENLEEHLHAFLNANNAQGFEPLAPDSIAPLGNFLWDIAQYPYVMRSKITPFAREIKLITQKKIRHCSALEMIARLYGYYSFTHMMHAASVDGRITNHRHGKLDAFEIFSMGDDPSLYRVLNTKPPQHPVALIPDQVRGKYKASELMMILNEFRSQFRIGKIAVADEMILKDWAARRFFELDKFSQLKPYVVKKEFPPFFNIANIERSEMKLAAILSTPQAQKVRTIEQVANELKTWCEDEKIFAKLQRALLFLVEGNVDAPVAYWVRKYGVCGVVPMLGPLAYSMNKAQRGIAFLTKNDRIARILIQEPKANYKGQSE